MKFTRHVRNLGFDGSLHNCSHYTPRFNEVERGVYWYHLVRLSVCGQNRVRSVSSTILIRSISYLHILSSNFRRCVVCNARFEIKIFWNFGEFFKFVTLTLSSFDLGSNMTQWYGQSWGGGGYPPNAGVLVVLVLGLAEAGGKWKNRGVSQGANLGLMNIYIYIW